MRGPGTTLAVSWIPSRPGASSDATSWPRPAFAPPPELKDLGRELQAGVQDGLEHLAADLRADTHLVSRLLDSGFDPRKVLTGNLESHGDCPGVRD